MTTDRKTHRWRGVTALGFLGLAGGALFSSPALLLASMLSVGFAAYAVGADPPRVDLAVERDLSATDPDPGERVTVTTTVRNVGESALADLRVVDGVPEGLPVVEGAARTYTALRAGESATFSYAVEAARGDHQFGDVTVFARDASGAVERETTVAGDDAALTCVPRLESEESVPLRPVTDQQAGTVTSGTAGPGAEFHSVREYRPGDALNRVAWNRMARTGELSTVEFNAERMATVVLVVDLRERAFATSPADRPHAVEHGVDAARHLLGGLLSDGNRVGVAGLGPDVEYLGPGLGRAHRSRAREFLATALPRSPPGERFLPRHLDELRRRLRGDVQVFWLTPLLDDYAVSIARRFVTDGHAVTVVSPDVTAADTPGERLARAERQLRFSTLRESGVRVVDWSPADPLAVAMAAAERGWGR